MIRPLAALFCGMLGFQQAEAENVRTWTVKDWEMAKALRAYIVCQFLNVSGFSIEKTTGPVAKTDEQFARGAGDYTVLIYCGGWGRGSNRALFIEALIGKQPLCLQGLYFLPLHTDGLRWGRRWG